MYSRNGNNHHQDRFLMYVPAEHEGREATKSDGSDESFLANIPKIIKENKTRKY